MGKKRKEEFNNIYKEIESFINDENESKKNKFVFQQKKVKMPLKMYLGIKNSVIKKQKKLDEFNKKNDIIAQTNFNNKKERFMTKFIMEKVKEKNERKKNKKLLYARNKIKSQLKEGTLKLGKKFKNLLKNNNNNNKN